MKFDDGYMRIIKQLDEEGLNGDQIISAIKTLEHESGKMAYKQLKILYSVIMGFVEFYLISIMAHKFLKEKIYEEY